MKPAAAAVTMAPRGMNIGLVLNTCEPFYHGGYETRAWVFARALAARGHRVTIFTSCPEWQTLDGVEFVPLAPRRNYFNSRGVRNLYADLLFAGAVRKLARWEGEFDVIDACATPFAHLPPLARVCRRRGWPLLATCHEALRDDIDAYVNERGVRSARLGRPYVALLKWIYQHGMRAADQRLAVSATTARGLAQEGWGNVPVVEFGLEKMPEQLPQKNREPVLQLIFVGRLTLIKRVTVVLEALARVKAANGNFRFHIVGTGAVEVDLRRHAAAVGLGSEVIFHGRCDDSERDSLLEGADVFVLPSLREGFSVATLEAMARGAAVIAASAPPPARPNAVLDYLQDGKNALIFDGSAELLAERIIRLSNDAALLASLQREAFATAQRYALAGKVDALEAVYRSMARTAR